MHSVHLVIRGRVQGVGFRYFLARCAESLGTSGRVWNRPDGAVEVEAEGPRAVLESLVDAARRGPAGARVATVEEQWSEGTPRHRGFQIGHGGAP